MGDLQGHSADRFGAGGASPRPRRQQSSSDITRALLKKREEEIDRRVADLKSRLQDPDSQVAPTRGSSLGVSSTNGGQSASLGSSPRTMARQVSAKASGGPTTPSRRHDNPTGGNSVKFSSNAASRRDSGIDSDDSTYGVNRTLVRPNPIKGFGGSRAGTSTFSDHRGSAESDGGNLSRGTSATSYPTNKRIQSLKKPSFVPASKSTKKAGWFSWCCPRRAGASDAAAAANSRFERQRLLAEEGRLQFNNGYDSDFPGGSRNVVQTPGGNTYGIASGPYSYNSAPGRPSLSRRTSNNSRTPRLNAMNGAPSPSSRY